MKFPSLFELIKKALLYKRLKKNKLKEQIIKEAKELSPSRKEIGLVDKRKALKSVYKRILSNTPYSSQVPVFMQLIDNVPDEYIRYEIGINLDKAMSLINELIIGSGDFTDGELKNIMNIAAGVGFPAIEKHATGKHKLPEKTAAFGAGAINRNLKEFLDSLARRRGQKAIPSRTSGKEPVPVSKELMRHDKLAIVKEALEKAFSFKGIGNTEFGRIAEKIKTPGINTERLAKSILGAIEKSASVKELEQKVSGLGFDFSKGNETLETLYVGVRKLKKENEQKRELR